MSSSSSDISDSDSSVDSEKNVIQPLKLTYNEIMDYRNITVMLANNAMNDTVRICAASSIHLYNEPIAQSSNEEVTMLDDNPPTSNVSTIAKKRGKGKYRTRVRKGLWPLKSTLIPQLYPAYNDYYRDPKKPTSTNDLKLLLTIQADIILQNEFNLLLKRATHSIKYSVVNQVLADLHVDSIIKLLDNDSSRIESLDSQPYEIPRVDSLPSKQVKKLLFTKSDLAVGKIFDIMDVIDEEFRKHSSSKYSKYLLSVQPDSLFECALKANISKNVVINARKRMKLLMAQYLPKSSNSSEMISSEAPVLNVQDKTMQTQLDKNTQGNP
ncbi:hypothetical protein BC833DRAFT_612989 [Globomyces pollinis-pini]|nr:hypothetical protein BC833DRAFT_612989 [Globomyces pollinis-pini]